ncbi:MAG: hypothetical protein HC874_14235 [Richelia sp. SL_2_1]|nr:hypothetical protein [Richelia sp. SL_2_1]
MARPIFFLAALLICLSAFGQSGGVKPQNFTRKNDPDGNDHIYSQAGGLARRIHFSDARKYFGATIAQRTTAPAASGNADSLRNKLFFVTADTSIWFVDWAGAGLKVSIASASGGSGSTLALAQGDILIGNTSGVAQGRTMNGDAENDYLGNVTVTRLRNRPLSAVTPTTRQTYRYYGGAWYPASDTTYASGVNVSQVGFSIIDGGADTTDLQSVLNDIDSKVANLSAGSVNNYLPEGKIYIGDNSDVATVSAYKMPVTLGAGQNNKLARYNHATQSVVFDGTGGDGNGLYSPENEGDEIEVQQVIIDDNKNLVIRKGIGARFSNDSDSTSIIVDELLPFGLSGMLEGDGVDSLWFTGIKTVCNPDETYYITYNGVTSTSVNQAYEVSNTFWGRITIDDSDTTYTIVFLANESEINAGAIYTLSKTGVNGDVSYYYNSTKGIAGESGNTSFSHSSDGLSGETSNHTYYFVGANFFTSSGEGEGIVITNDVGNLEFRVKSETVGGLFYTATEDYDELEKKGNEAIIKYTPKSVGLTTVDGVVINDDGLHLFEKYTLPNEQPSTDDGDIQTLGWTRTSGVTVPSFLPYDFLALRDTPDSYTGLAGYVPRVNSGETGLEFTLPAQNLYNSADALSFLTTNTYSTGANLDYGSGTWFGGWGVASNRGQFFDTWNYENASGNQNYLRILQGRLSGSSPATVVNGDASGGIYFGAKVSGTGVSFSGGFAYPLQLVGDNIGFVDANNVRANFRFKQNTASGAAENALSFLYARDLASIYYANTRNDSGRPTKVLSTGDASGTFRLDDAWETGQLTIATEVSAGTTAVIGQELPVNSTSGAISIDAPDSPVAGDRFAVFDSRGTATTNNITINFTTGSQKLHGTVQNYVISVSNAGVEFTYVNSTIGWRKKTY